MRDQSNNNSVLSPIIWLGLIIAFVLIGLALFLPPFSIGDLIWGSAEPELVSTVDSVAEDAPESVAEPTEPTVSTANNVSTFSAEGDAVGVVVADEAIGLDASLTTVGDVYFLDGAGRGSLKLAQPAGSADWAMLDMIGFDGTNWSFIPSESMAGQFVSPQSDYPRAVALVKHNEPAVLVGAEVLPEQGLAGGLLDTFGVLSLGRLIIDDAGGLSGSAEPPPPNSATELLHITNVEFVADTNVISSILTSPEITIRHIKNIVDAVETSGFDGVNINYQGIPAGLSEQYPLFLTQLGSKLKDDGLALGVTLETPLNSQPASGQDWHRIGAIADYVIVPMPLDPTEFGDGDAAETIIRWSTNRIDRQKLILSYTASAIEQVDGAFFETDTANALQNFGSLTLLQGGNPIPRGGTVEVGLAGSASPLEWDGIAGAYTYNFSENNQTHTVWLSNEAALAYQMRLAQRYNIGGVIVRGLDNFTGASSLPQTFASLNGGEPPAPSAAGLIWTLTDAQDQIIESSSEPNRFSYAWQNADQIGDFTINAIFAQGDNQTTLSSFPLTVIDPAEFVPTPTITPVPTSTPEPTATPLPPTGVTQDILNFRATPRSNGQILDVLARGTTVDLLGRDSTNAWLYVRNTTTLNEGWVFQSLITYDIDLFSLPIITP